MAWHKLSCYLFCKTTSTTSSEQQERGTVQGMDFVGLFKPNVNFFCPLYLLPPRHESQNPFGKLHPSDGDA